MTVRVCRYLLLLCLLPLTVMAGEATTLRVGGTGAATAILEKLAAEYRRGDPTATIEIVSPPLGSSAGIRAVAAGQVDMAFSGRALKPAEAATLEMRELARTPLAFVVNGPVGKMNLSQRELLDIYAGKKLRWDDGTPLRLVLRPASDSDAETLSRWSPEMAQVQREAYARPGMVIATNDQENVDMLRRARGVFGTITLCQLRAKAVSLQTLTLDGIAPSSAAVAAGRYPLVKSLFVVTRLDAPVAATRFARFLFSPAARRILAGHECQPIAD